MLEGIDNFRRGMIFNDCDFLNEIFSVGGSSVSEILSGSYAKQNDTISLYKSAIAELPSDPALSDSVDQMYTELNMTFDEMLEYFSVTELQQ